MKLKTAQSRVRGTRNSSYLTKGSDNFDHRGLNKARRMIDRALIEEQLFDDDLPDLPDYQYVLYRFVDDGDTWGEWVVRGVFKTEKEMCEYFNRIGIINFFIDGVLQLPEGFQVNYVDVKVDYDAIIWLNYFP